MKQALFRQSLIGNKSFSVTKKLNGKQATLSRNQTRQNSYRPIFKLFLLSFFYCFRISFHDEEILKHKNNNATFY